MPIDTKTIAELRALHEKATPGELSAVWNNYYWELQAQVDGGRIHQIGDCCSSKFIYYDTETPTDVEAENAALIAAAWNALPALLTTASNEALMTAERDFWRSETQRETEKSQGLQREVEALRAVLNDAMVAFAVQSRDRGMKLGEFERMAVVKRARAALTLPAASEEDAL